MKMLKTTTLIMCLALVSFGTNAQKKKANLTIVDKTKIETEATGISNMNVASTQQTIQPVEKHEVTEECIVNTSLFTEYAKVKNYADALDPWQKVYNDCPTASKNIYIQGVNIINWQISQTSDAVQRNELIDKLMKLFDDRIKFYGNDKKMPREKILAQKAYYHSVYRPDDKTTIYPWLKEAVTKLGNAAEPSCLQQFVVTSHDLYKADNSLAEQFINDYTLANTYLTENSTNTALKDMETYKTVKQGVDVLFAASGVADCDKMNAIFLPNVELNKDNQTYLQSTMRLFRGVKCTENDAYFKAAEYSHKIAPSAESAAGMGNMCFGKQEFKEASKYYEEAAELSTEDSDIADNQFRIALCYFRMDQFVKAREYCKLSLTKKPEQGAPHILLGTMYASAKGIFEDPTLAKSVYWAAVDQFVKARNAEPDNQQIVDQANKLIQTFKVYFPSTEEVFMHPEISEGKSFHVGGWVNETTTARAK